MTGPCLCGDPYCGRCFPQYREDNDDAVIEADEIARQKELDSGEPNVQPR